MILEIKEHKEYHKNGNLWISGQIAIVAGLAKHLYNCAPLCRVGTWCKYYDNGQLAWTLKYDDYGNVIKEDSPQYRKDGTIVTY